MARHRQPLPSASDRVFLADSGLETVLIFHEGVDLPDFAAFPLLLDDRIELLRSYYLEHVKIAAEHGTGIVLESPTWRASPDWAKRLGFDTAALAEANRLGIELLAEIRDGFAGSCPVVISGSVGPRGDGYQPDVTLTAEQAREYHREQVGTFAETDADVVSILTVNTVDEAVGFARAAEDAGMPAVVSFTVETDGALPGGTSLADAVRTVDDVTGGYPGYYMINCAHPDHFASVLEADSDWVRRIRGLRANASRMSHAELDAAEELDDGSPTELGERYARLRDRHPRLTVLGGCCGTDARHISAIADACLTTQHVR